MHEMRGVHFREWLGRELQSLRQRQRLLESGDLQLMSSDQQNLTQYEIELVKAKIWELEKMFGPEGKGGDAVSDVRRAG